MKWRESAAIFVYQMIPDKKGVPTYEPTYGLMSLDHIRIAAGPYTSGIIISYVVILYEYFHTSVSKMFNNFRFRGNLFY